MMKITNQVYKTPTFVSQVDQCQTTMRVADEHPTKNKEQRNAVYKMAQKNQTVAHSDSKGCHCSPLPNDDGF